MKDDFELLEISIKRLKTIRSYIDDTLDEIDE